MTLATRETFWEANSHQRADIEEAAKSLVRLHDEGPWEKLTEDQRFPWYVAAERQQTGLNLLLKLDRALKNCRQTT